MVYTSESLSLATLELLVHAAAAHLFAAGFVTVELALPDDLAVESLPVSGLPSDWRDYPPPPELPSLGEDWVRSARTAVLRVPSAVIPSESNLLLNPAHPEFGFIRVVATAPFDPDPRLRG